MTTSCAAAFGKNLANASTADLLRYASQQLTGTPPKIKLRSVPDTEIQAAIDVAWTHREPVNAAQVKAFGLQPDRPLV